MAGQQLTHLPEEADVRAILAGIAGIITVMVVVVGGTFAAAALLAPDPEALTPAYLGANLAISLLGAVVGGIMAARIEPRRPWLAGGVTAAIMALLAVPGGFEPAPGQPGGYPLGVFLIGLAGLALGVLLQQRWGSDPG